MAEWTTEIANALLNSVWQGLALAGLAAAHSALNRRASAAARYAVWYVALLGTVALPVAHLLRFQPRDTVAAAPPRVIVESTNGLPAEAGPAADEPLPETAFAFPLELPSGPVTFGLVLCWGLAAAVLAIRLGAASLRLTRLKGLAEPVATPVRSWWLRWRLEEPSERAPELLVSNAVRVPMTAGFLAPAIIFPRRLLNHLTESEVHAVWLHELAHVQRLDDWTKLGQKLAEALLNFHPAVHWIGRRLEMEREIACDDWVVRRTGAPKPYAACLAKIARFAAAGPGTSLAPAMAGEKKQIFRRVNMLVNKNRTENRESRISGWLGVATVAALALGLVFAGPLVVVAQSPEPPPATPDVESPPPPPAPASSEARPVTPAPPAPPAPSVAEVAAVPAVPSVPLVAAVPPAPPVPPVQAPEPVPAPNPPSEPNPRSEARGLSQAERQAIREEVRKYQEQISELSRQISEEVRVNLKPRMEEIRKSTEAIRAEVEKSIRPSTAEISRLSAELARMAAEVKPDETQMRELESKIRAIEETTIRQAEERIREIENQIRAQELDVRPSEETMRKFEEKMRELEKKLQEKLKDIEARRSAKEL